MLFKDIDCGISPENYEMVVSETKKINTLNIQSVKCILRKLNLKQYYEHAYHLICRINGNKFIPITYDTEMKLRMMFKLIQNPYHKHSYPRINFFNYSYVAYKFFELLEMDYYSNAIRLLQNNEKLEEHDRIWEKICGELEWKFYPSHL